MVKFSDSLSWNVLEWGAEFQLICNYYDNVKETKRHLVPSEGCRANRTQVFGPSEGKRNTEQAGVCGVWAELGVLQGSMFSFYTPGRADWGEGPRPPSSLCCVYLSCLMCSVQESNMAMSKNVLFRFYSMPHVCAVHVPVSVCLNWIVCLCICSVNDKSVWVCAQCVCFKTSGRTPQLWKVSVNRT